MQQTNETLLDKIGRFYRNYYHEDIGELALGYPSDQRTLEIDFGDVYQFDMELADDLREQPKKTLEHFDEALTAYESGDVSLAKAEVVVGGLPETAEFEVGAYRSNNVGEYVTVTGQVAKTTPIRPRPTTIVWECRRCGTNTRIPLQTGEIQSPHECEGCERQGPFRINQSESEYTDHQLLRLKQPPEQARGGEGAKIDVHIEGDLVGNVEAGDRAKISGTIYLDDEDAEDQTAFDPYLQGRHVEVEETDYEDIDIDDHEEDIREIASGERGDPYQLLIDSIAPGVQGMDELKEAIGLQLFGGVRKELPGGETKRAHSHILLLGDPGTAKSTILRAVKNIAPRGVFASGKGASAAGMTASAVNDDFGDNSWTLEAGALVIANNGIACVDEIDKVDEDAKDSMHSALEQQYIDINKAGINAELPARTALLAAGNPKRGRFDPNTAYAEQIDLDPAMISRFDLMFMVDDQPQEERDAMIVGGMLDDHQLGAKYTDSPESLTEEELEQISPAIDRETLRAYVAMAKKRVTPKISDEFKQELEEWYVDLRNIYGDASDAPIPVTARKAEGIIRLAEASARVRLSETVELEDLERAKKLALRSMRDVGMDPETGQFDADIVETGTSKSQRDRIDSILDFVREMQNETGDPVSHDDIMGWARETAGIGTNQTKHEIKVLLQKGELYEPETQKYRIPP